MFQNGGDLFQDNHHESKMDKVAIANQPVQFAVVDDEIDVGRHPDGLDGGKVNAANAGTGVCVAGCEDDN